MQNDVQKVCKRMCKRVQEVLEGIGERLSIGVSVHAVVVEDIFALGLCNSS